MTSPMQVQELFHNSNSNTRKDTSLMLRPTRYLMLVEVKMLKLRELSWATDQVTEPNRDGELYMLISSRSKIRD
jgi:hypothetical protein